MKYYVVTYYTKRNVVSRAFILKSDAIKFYEKVICRESVDFACLDFNTTEFSLNRLKTYRK